MAEVVIERLTRGHDRTGFDSGEPKYNSFVQRTALQHVRQNVSVTWVAVEPGSSRILGYVTLSMGHVAFANVSEELARTLPKHPIPVLHVGKLAVDLEFAGRGIGSLLLRFAAEQAVAASKMVGCYALQLEADDDRLGEYYLRKGFLLLQERSRNLYQSVAVLEQAMLEAAIHSRKA